MCAKGNTVHTASKLIDTGTLYIRTPRSNKEWTGNVWGLVIWYLTPNKALVSGIGETILIKLQLKTNDSLFINIHYIVQDDWEEKEKKSTSSAFCCCCFVSICICRARRDWESSLFCRKEKRFGDKTVPFGCFSLCLSRSSNLSISESGSHGQKPWNSGDVVGPASISWSLGALCVCVGGGEDREGGVPIISLSGPPWNPRTQHCLIAQNLIFLKSLPFAPYPSLQGVG